ncbi:acyltransferase [Bosea sp. F3-2]|uniref:acyltransferase family protein n=1 Tax=Bosea sp. F3-2 TaxID=2599640 RepID=UPI0011EFA329|nr:acyltransferase [Bosea sp. F3-2]QEL21717.1 acyltransferase [Bosea sp. F3-2]
MVTFKDALRRLDDIDLPRIGATIGVGDTVQAHINQAFLKRGEMNMAIDTGEARPRPRSTRLSPIYFGIEDHYFAAAQKGQGARCKQMLSRNRSLDGLRGVAVILTFLVHFCGTYMATFRGGNPNVVRFGEWNEPLDRLLYWLFHSHHGVYIFFMLSGFLICRIALKSPFRYIAFVGKRLVRVYPAFLLALAVCAALGPFLLIPPPTWGMVGMNLFFLNGVPSLAVPGIVFNNVTWSLFYEMAFYLVFPPVIMAARRAGIPVLPPIIFAGLAAAYLPMIVGFYAEFFLFLFAGAAVATLSQTAVKAVAEAFPDYSVIALYLLITSLFTVGLLTTSQFVWAFAGCGSVILCKAIDGQSEMARALAWKPFSQLGRISYSFYLLHSVAISLVFKEWWVLYIYRLGPVVNAAYLAAVAFIGSGLFAWISYQIAERFYFRGHAPVDVRAAEPA